MLFSSVCVCVSVCDCGAACVDGDDCFIVLYRIVSCYLDSVKLDVCVCPVSVCSYMFEFLRKI